MPSDAFRWDAVAPLTAMPCFPWPARCSDGSVAVAGGADADANMR